MHKLEDNIHNYVFIGVYLIIRTAVVSLSRMSPFFICRGTRSSPFTFSAATIEKGEIRGYFVACNLQP